MAKWSCGATGAGQGKQVAAGAVPFEADRSSYECCEAVREDVARLRAGLMRTWLLRVRGCHERALRGFADIYELAAGVSNKAWARKCCGAHDVVRSLCHVLDRGAGADRKLLQAVAEHIDALEETVRLRSEEQAECGRGELRMRLRMTCVRAGVAPPTSLMLHRAVADNDAPGGEIRTAGS